MNARAVKRVASLVAIAAVAIAAAAIFTGSPKKYVVRAVFADTGGLVSGFTVRIDGAPVGKVGDLKLSKQDQVIATLDLDPSAAPVGRNARATVRAADLLGEKYVDLQPGNRQDPMPSAGEIPIARTGLAIELDDVLNALDVPTRDQLRVLLNEQGTAFAGRGQDLAALLAALPPSLDQTQQLLSQLGQNNAALGRLVDESDRVVAAVTDQRAPLGRLVGSAAATLRTLAGKRAQLGQTIERAPATLASLRRALVALEGAAIPLGPAAQGLATTAPQLTATLNQLPAFTAAARPTLAIIRQVAPTLRRLGRSGTPVVRRLVPLTSKLATFASTLSPVTDTLDNGAADLLGFMEGWARSTQARDASGHVFRFGLAVSPVSFGSLLAADPGTARPRTPVRARPSLQTPGPTGASRPAPVPQRPGPSRTLSSVLSQALGNVGLGTATPQPATPLQSLLTYLLK
jgi:phospholipid/cholesterol/gamma-HCH transport system substrate-binding protein